MQHLSTSRGIIRPHCLFLQTVALCLISILISLAEAQNNSSSCGASQQPVITSVNPPSGSSETTYRVGGDNLNETRNILVLRDGNNVGTAVETADGYNLMLDGALITDPSLVTVVFVPLQDGCVNATVELYVVEREIFLMLSDDPLIVQPGTVAATVRSACLPDDCGDNSTDYEVIVNGHQLQKVVPATRRGFVVRFPDTNVTFPATEISIQTFYSLLTISGVDVMFRKAPPITSVSPSMGQRGTRVVIQGEDLLGYGEGIKNISRVEVGGSPANISYWNATHIFARLNSGTANSTSIRINTTQDISRLDKVHDGPYTYSNNLWTQLEDGVVTELLPPAAQIGEVLSICGERLLGGGNNVTTISMAGQMVVIFSEVRPYQNLGRPSECITATVPDIPNPQNIVNGSIVIEADTGALVESLDNTTFTYAHITTINPTQGQVGTEVTITGIELLSGYRGLTPTVYLSDVKATVINASRDTVIVRVENPSPFQPTGSGNFLSPITTGDVVVSVTRDGQDYNVSMSDGWTYLEAGVIEQVEPGYGQIGTRITINGTNLLGYGSNLSQALIGNITATIISNTDTIVVLEAPDIPVLGFVDIVLVSDNGARVSREQAFEYLEKGTITSLNPSSGQIGTRVVITGSNLFGHADNVSEVTFGGIQADIDYTQANDTQITVRIRSNNVTSDTPVPVLITGSTLARVSSSGNIWTYLVPGSIGDVRPNIGQNGTVVNITGTNLLGGGNSVQSIFLDGVPAAVSGVATATLISVTMEDLSNQTNFYRNIVHIVANTGAIIMGGSYNHRASGMITDFDPRMGREGTRITITGNNLSGYGARIDQVLIAGVEATIINQNNGSVIVGAGPASEGRHGTVVLISNTGAVVSSADSLVFNYTVQGTISNVIPSEGAEGSGILIEGVSLKLVGTAIIRVTIGGSPVSRIVTESESEVSVIAGPASETGDSNVTIVLTADDGSVVRGGHFSYLSLTLSLPNNDQGQLGTKVRINLPDDDSFIASLPLVARIGGQMAEIVASSESDRTIAVAAPRAGEVGTYMTDVTVEGIDGRVARLRNGFRYIEEGVVFNVNPTTGQQGTRIRLTGRNLLGGGSNISTARIGDRNGPKTNATVTSSNDNFVDIEITSNLPAGSTYPLLSDITLVADTGATVISIRQFTLVQPGQISSVTPAQGQFGTRVTISGSNLLQGGSREDIFSITLSGTEILEILDTPSPPSDAQITVRADASSEGDPGEVIIALMSGARIVSPSSVTFKYLSPGRIDTVEPSNGTVGTNVLISGANLLGGGRPLEITLGGTTTNISGTPNDTLIEVRAGGPRNGHSSGTVEIVIDTGAIISGGVWTFEELGTITSISPTVGQQGVAVTAVGESLLGSSASSFTSCTIAGIVGFVNQSRNDEAICIAGFNPFAGINPNETQLSGPLVLTANSGPVLTSTDMFSYYVAYIGMIEPTNGTNGTYVTITGRNLIYNDDLYVAAVTFGGISTLVGTTRVVTNDTISVRVGYSNSSNEQVRLQLNLTSGAFFVLENAWEYTQPGVITSISPLTALPGDEVYIYGTNLVPPHVDGVTVVVGQTRSYEAIVNGSSVVFRPGPYQDGINVDTDLDIPNFDLPIQVIASNGATVYSENVVFQYNVSTSRVTGIVPTAGVEGTEVNITGMNLLNGSSTAVRVTLAGRNATILNATDSLVRVIAGEGPNEGSRGRVIIEGDNGRVSGIGRDIWEYFPVITAADVRPQMGQNETTVSIDLKDISLIVTDVYLAGVRARRLSHREGTLTVAAGPSLATSLGDITIEFSGESAVLIIPAAWQYLEPVTVSSFTPEQGYYNTSVTIRGANFQVGGRVESVQLAGLNTEVISQNDTEIIVRVIEFRDSSSSPIEGPVTIYSQDGATYWSTIEFTYVQLRVDEVTPQSGQNGTVVTVTGVGLLAGSSLSFQQFQLGGVDVQSVITITNTEIRVAAAPYPAQTNESDITYTVADGGTVTIPDSWRYLQLGRVTSVTPSYGAQGSYITIRGENMLQGGTTVANVIVAGVPVMEVVVGFSDFIYIRLGRTPNSPPRGPINIESDTGASLLESDIEFVYNTSGNVGIISLSAGQNGTRVTINGIGFITFGAVSRVTLAGVEATLVEEVTDTSITVEAGRPDTFEEFQGEVIVETVSGTIITGNPIFTYLQEGIIYRASPPQGQMQTRVVISGENLFGGGSSLESVYLAGIKAEIIENESNDSFVSVTAAASERAPVVGDIILISNTGAYVRKTDSWSYVAPGSISTIQPTVGQFGTRITISGNGLLSGGDSISSVLIGSIESYDVLSSSDTEVVARAGQPNRTGTFTETVTLVSNFGGQLASSSSWTYLNSSEITSVSPMMGLGGDMVTVNGTNLLGGGTMIVRVTTAGIEAINIVGSDDQIEFRVGPEPNGAAIQGDIVVESDTGALTIVKDGWSYISACPEGEFGTVDNCSSCSEECTACRGPTDEDCITCENFMIPLSESSMRCVNKCPNVSTLANVCVDNCDLNQFRRVDTVVNATFCHDCHPLCDAQLGCSGPNATQCSGCEVALDVNTQACVSGCPTGTWQNEMKECIPCDSQCLSSAGCFGNTNTDCYECRNVQAPSPLIQNDSTSEPVNSYICLERCPPNSYEEDGDCFPCDSECEGGCTGPTPFDCNRCASVSRIQASNTLCVSSCNANLTANSLFQDSDGSCQACSDLCSLGDGCTGPTDSDCITCHTNASTNATLPRFNGTCVLVCPNTTASVSPTPSQFYYHNMATGTCELCDSSCTNGCSGSSADDCLESDNETTSLFAAGAATIGITASIIAILAILCAVLFLMSLWCWVKNPRRNKYKLHSSVEDTEPASELVYRYSRPEPKDTTTSTQIQETVNPGLEDAEYTPMSPTSPVAPLIRSQSPQHGPIVKVEERYKEVSRPLASESSVTMIENEGASLYCEAGPDAPQVPARPAKPVQEQPTVVQKSSIDRRGKPPPQKKPERAPVPLPQSGTGKQAKKAAAPPPQPDGEMYTEMSPLPTEGEFYTEMTASVQEVYVNPSGNTQDEEYSEMKPLPGIQELVYDDTVDNLPSPQGGSEATMEPLYEDTELTTTSPSYMKHSSSAQPVGSAAVPLPQKRRSVPLPLPETPLDRSIKGTQPPQPVVEEVYVDPENVAAEESLYEPIPTSARGRPLPAAPSPEIPPKGVARTSGNYIPLPPREKR